MIIKIFIILLIIVAINYIINKNKKSKVEQNLTEKEKKREEKVEVIFFDTETNGFKVENSVLSISAIKVLVDFENKNVTILDRYKRFYYSIEPYNIDAIRVNGLTQEYVDKKRDNEKYPRYFKDDQQAFFNFCGEAKHFVAHNIEFDRKFLNRDLPKQFCTMKSNTDIIKLPPQRIGTKYKWPKLEEATQFYQISTDKNMFHDSMYDVEMTIEVFKAMLENRVGRELIEEFLYNPNYSYKEFNN